MHRRMVLIRGFEQRVSVLYRDGEVPGFVHLSIGQEASAVGACWPLRPADVLATIYHCLGLSPDFELRDRQQRPYALMPWGSVINDLLE